MQDVVLCAEHFVCMQCSTAAVVMDINIQRIIRIALHNLGNCFMCHCTFEMVVQTQAL